MSEQKKFYPRIIRAFEERCAECNRKTDEMIMFVSLLFCHFCAHELGATIMKVAEEIEE